MKRDMDLVREILMKVEANEKPTVPIAPFEIDGYLPEIVYHHIHLLDDAGLLTALGRPGMDQWFPKALTWEGHDFLDAVRDPDVWAKTKQGALAAGGWTFDLALDIAKGFIRKKVEDLSGISL